MFDLLLSCLFQALSIKHHGMGKKKKNPCTVYQEGPIKSAVMDLVSLGNGLGKKGQEDLPKR